jgi:hypothetical protein
MKRNCFPPSIVNLLLQEGQRWKVNGSMREALGTGIIPIVASARGGKTSLAYAFIDYVIEHTNRPVILDSFPQVVIDEGIPAHWAGRVSNTSFNDIAKVEGPAVWLLDDAATNFNSRSSMSNGNQTLSKAAGVLSHFGGGMTVLFTTQSMSGIDLSLLRYTTISPIIRWVDADLIPQERKEWKGEIEHGQWELRKICKDIRFRDYFWSAKDGMLVKAPFPKFLSKEVDPKKADLLSRPMRYHSIEDKEVMLGIVKPPQKRRQKRKKVET